MTRTIAESNLLGVTIAHRWISHTAALGFRCRLFKPLPYPNGLRRDRPNPIPSDISELFSGQYQEKTKCCRRRKTRNATGRNRPFHTSDSPILAVVRTRNVMMPTRPRLRNELLREGVPYAGMARDMVVRFPVPRPRRAPTPSSTIHRVRRGSVVTSQRGISTRCDNGWRHIGLPAATKNTNTDHATCFESATAIAFPERSGRVGFC